MNSTYKERLLQDTDERSSAFLTQFSNRLHIDTCERLEVALAKYPLILRHLGGENDLVHHPPAVQSAHQSHRLGHHQFGCGESSVTLLSYCRSTVPHRSASKMLQNSGLVTC